MPENRSPNSNSSRSKSSRSSRSKTVQSQARAHQNIEARANAKSRSSSKGLLSGGQGSSREDKNEKSHSSRASQSNPRSRSSINSSAKSANQYVGSNPSDNYREPSPQQRPEQRRQQAEAASQNRAAQKQAQLIDKQLRDPDRTGDVTHLAAQQMAAREAAAKVETERFSRARANAAQSRAMNARENVPLESPTADRKEYRTFRSKSNYSPVNKYVANLDKANRDAREFELQAEHAAKQKWLSNRSKNRVGLPGTPRGASKIPIPAKPMNRTYNPYYGYDSYQKKQQRIEDVLKYTPKLSADRRKNLNQELETIRQLHKERSNRKHEERYLSKVMGVDPGLETQAVLEGRHHQLDGIRDLDQINGKRDPDGLLKQVMESKHRKAREKEILDEHNYGKRSRFDLDGDGNVIDDALVVGALAVPTLVAATTSAPVWAPTVVGVGISTMGYGFDMATSPKPLTPNQHISGLAGIGSNALPNPYSDVAGIYLGAQHAFGEDEIYGNRSGWHF